MNGLPANICLIMAGVWFLYQGLILAAPNLTLPMPIVALWMILTGLALILRR